MRIKFIVILSVFIVACSSPDIEKKEEEVKTSDSLENKDTPIFTKLDEESGFDFVNELIETSTSNVLRYEYMYNGSGVAIGDINNDGLPDIFMGGNFFGGRLYLNKGNLKFEQISDNAGVFFAGFSTGVSFVDINNDGYDDIYICRSKSNNVEERRNILLINNKDLTFTNRASEYGVDDPGFASNAIFMDYDNDLDLDLFILNHRNDFNNSSILPIHGNEYPFEVSDINYCSNRLYKNEDGKFRDVSVEAGVQTNRFGLGVFAEDINNDGWVDIYVANDFNDQDQLLINNGKGKFVDQIDKYFDHISKNSMGCEVGDYNNDGLEDIVTLDMTPEHNYRQKQLRGAVTYDMYHLGLSRGLGHQVIRNCLHVNEGSQHFYEAAQLNGISHTDWSWTPILADFDNDGRKDLFISNGYYRDVTDMDYIKYGQSGNITKGGGITSDWQLKLIQAIKSTPIPNYLYKNTKAGFKDISTENWGLDSSFTNGCVYADLDLDGDLDLIMNNFNKPSSIYKNNTDNTDNNFVAFIPEKGMCKVHLFYGDNIQTVNSNPYRGYMSSHHNVAHFGLGKEESIDSVIIQFAGGKTRVLKNIEINKYHKVSDKTGEPSQKPNFSKPLKLSLTKIGDFMKKNEEKRSKNDFKSEPLLSRKNSNKGPSSSKGDINNDGRIDLFVGGESGISSKVLIAESNGSYRLLPQPELEMDHLNCDASSSLFDYDGDGDLDLFVGGGGYFKKDQDPFYKDRLYINDGDGIYKKENSPSLLENSSFVYPVDLNSDNRQDMIIFAGAKPGNYPECGRSYVLINSKDGFKIDTTILPLSGYLGIVSCAIEYEPFGKNKIVISREWDPLLVLEFGGNEIIDVTSNYQLEKSSGIWNSIAAIDIDGDGKKEIAGCNVGTNDYYKVNQNFPGQLVYGDFLNAGGVDALQFYQYRDKEYYPKFTLEELFEQNPMFRKFFPTYKSYSVLNMKGFLNYFKDRELKVKKLYNKNSGYYKWELNDLVYIPFHDRLQLSELRKVLCVDINKDGINDLVAVGNNYDVDVQQGRLDGGGVQVLLSNKNSSNDSFENHTYKRIATGEYTDIIELNNDILIVGKNYNLFKLNYHEKI